MNWLLRPYELADEPCVVSLWLYSHAASDYGKRIGLSVPKLDEIGRRVWTRDATKFHAYWRAHSPLVIKLIKRAPPTILCDPQAHDVVWAFACSEPGAVHMFVRKFKFQEYGDSMFHDLVRGEMAGSVASHEMPDTMGAIPYDEFWLARNL